MRSVALAFLRCVTVAAAVSAALRAQEATTSLPAITVYSPSVANQSPAGTFAMPVSALHYEPLVDIEPRNMAEAQSDITIRGDTFENTGMQIGALSISDPQTGHYLTELPIAPAMLGAPEILTGASHAIETMNSMAGAVAYDWRPITGAGFVSGAFGNDGLNREEVYEGWAASGANHLAADADWAHSSGNGTVPFGDFHFDRADARLRVRGAGLADRPVRRLPGELLRLAEPLHAVRFGRDREPADACSSPSTTGRSWGRRRLHRGRRVLPAQQGRLRLQPVRPAGPRASLPAHDLGIRCRAGGRQETGRRLSSTTTPRRRATGSGPRRSSSAPTTAARWRRSRSSPRSRGPSAGGVMTLKAGATYDESNRGERRLLAGRGACRRTWTAGGLRRALRELLDDDARCPSYTALDSSPTAGLFLGNPNLGRETSHDTEVGRQRADSSGGRARRPSSTGATTTSSTGPTRTGVFGRSANAVDLDTEGVELVARRSWGLVSAVLGYTALAKSADYLGAPVTASFYALNYARQRLTARLHPHAHGDARAAPGQRREDPGAGRLRTQGGDRRAHELARPRLAPAVGAQARALRSGGQPLEQRASSRCPACPPRAGSCLLARPTVGSGDARESLPRSLLPRPLGGARAGAGGAGHRRRARRRRVRAPAPSRRGGTLPPSRTPSSRWTTRRRP